ncbi:MAG TPA: hypothetical protein VN906_08855 [Candidatus Sulfotelmatobacter sp.]|nr:hypothetical protein [Candidatus Sulfotelmatobacter sp.]
MRLTTRARSIAASATSATAATPATALLVRSRRPSGIGAGRVSRPLRPCHDGDDSGQPARTAPPAGLLAGTRVHLLDALVEFSQPLFHRPLDLRARGAWLLRPDARPLGTNGFWRRIGVGRLGLDRDLRGEFRHLEKS